MKLNIFYIVLLCFLSLHSQTKVEVDSISQSADVKGSVWEHKNKFGVSLNEVAFVNWNSGGSNSISAAFSLEKQINFKDPYNFWNNKFNVRYGINKQESQKIRKTEDLFEVISNFGYKSDSLSNFFYSAKLNFKTQISNGYGYPNRSDYSSQFMAPGYLFLGGGFEYGKHIKELALYMSPLTLKATFVLDDTLADNGAFGVLPAEKDPDGNKIKDGKHTRRELGAHITTAFEKKLFENIKVKQLLSLYSDYEYDFGNIDVDWQFVLNFKVNKYVSATLDSHLKYDNDIKIAKASDIEGEFDQSGAKAQWKQLLGIGFEVDF